MRVKEITVYSFSELADDVKSKVLDSFRDINTETEWYECVLDEWTERLEEYGFIKPKIYFSGFGSQGDGACFDAGIDVKQIEGKFALSLPERLIPPFSRHRHAFENFLAESELRIITTNFRYSHENCRSIDYSTARSHGKYFLPFLEAFAEWLEAERKSLAQQIYRALEKEFDYLTSDEAVKETIEANDYEFTTTGKVA